MWIRCVVLVAVAAWTASGMTLPQDFGVFDPFDPSLFDGDTSTSTVSTTSTGTTTTTPTPEVALCLNNCPVTPEYNPVCGSNKMLYDNPGKLNCAALCGTVVSFKHYGPCISKQPQPSP